MSNGEAWDNEIGPIKSSLESLPAREKAAFALACAERLVRGDSGKRQVELSRILSRAWVVFNSGNGDCTSLRTSLLDRADVDDDPVAALIYALETLDGNLENTWWVANRAIDASVELVLYPEHAQQFRSLSEGLGAEPVQRELSWQRESVALLAREGASAQSLQIIRAER